MRTYIYIYIYEQYIVIFENLIVLLKLCFIHASNIRNSHNPKITRRSINPLIIYLVLENDVFVSESIDVIISMELTRLTLLLKMSKRIR